MARRAHTPGVRAGGAKQLRAEMRVSLDRQSVCRKTLKRAALSQAWENKDHERARKS
jgi:hypothetical protein